MPQQTTEEYPAFTRFLWWLATAEKELLAGTAIDSNRYSIVGMTVLATWCFATLAWTYFFSTVTANSWWAVPLGIFMGFIIVTIDRALIKSINRRISNQWLPVFFRIILAGVIGLFMAQPALLYLFKKEIQQQIVIDNTVKQITNSHQVDSLYSNRKNELVAQKTSMQQEMANRITTVNKARENFLAESDGSGGTGKVGIKAIALAKRNEYQKLDADYQQFIASNQPNIAAIDGELKLVEDAIKKDQTTFKQYYNEGFLTQVEALQHLLKDHPALQYRYYLLVAILLLIELMPITAKLLLPIGTYDEKLQLREAKEKEMAISDIEIEKELAKLYNTLALESDKEIITAFFAMSKEDRLEKIKAMGTQWKQNDKQSFEKFSKKMKQEMLSHPIV